MKKIILLIPLILLTGCTNKEKIFEDYAKTYYENHMKIVNNIDEATITLEDLQNASDEDGYDLKKLNKCDKQSKIIFRIEKDTKNIKNTEIELKC